MKVSFFSKLVASVLISLLPCSEMVAQSLTLEDAVETAERNSVSALEAKYSFISAYWAYRSFQASLLPSFNLYGTLGNYSRTQTLLQDYATGDVRYAPSNNLQNNLGLAIRQDLALTGGSVSLYSDLSRIDQFGQNSSLSWYSQPVTMSYTQPMFGYNRFKWTKKISPKEYERAKRVYVETMEALSGDVVESFYKLVLVQMQLDVASQNYKNTSEMLGIARERMTLGTVRKDDCLQLELRMLNDSISINENQVAIRQAQMNLNSLLGYDESYEAKPVIEEHLPDLTVDYQFVIDKAETNSSFDLANEINILNAQAAVAQAKADRGINMQLNARFGLSKSDREFNRLYTGLADQEVVGLSFSIPIYDWGMGKGKVQKAKAAEAVVRAQAEQGRNDFRRMVFTEVGKFNNMMMQCNSSRRAREIAEERYTLMMDSFRNGNSTVTELNTAQSEYNQAVQKYITDLCDYWMSYYSLRKLTLYDFIAGHDIDVDIDKLMDK